MTKEVNVITEKNEIIKKLVAEIERLKNTQEVHNPVQGHWEAHNYNWEFIEGEGWFCKCGRKKQ